MGTEELVMMQVGAKKSLVYIPSMGFLEVVGEERVKRKEEALTESEMIDNTILRRLQKQYPGCRIIQDGNKWSVFPKDS